MAKNYKRVLTIGVSDSGGCAGIQADLKTFSALGCFGTSAITSVTAQNTQGIMDIYHVSTTTLKKQITAVIEDIGVDAVKIGTLHTCEAIMTVSEIVYQYQLNNLVFDPFISIFPKDTLLKCGAIETFRKFIIPFSTVFTPHISEAALFFGDSLNPEFDSNRILRELASFGSQSVLLRAIPQEEDSLADIFYHSKENTTFKLYYRLPKVGLAHCMRCTLSSAIAAFLARGCGLEDSVSQARKYLDSALSRGYKYEIGHCKAPVHHFHEVWN